MQVSSTVIEHRSNCTPVLLI